MDFEEKLKQYNEELEKEFSVDLSETDSVEMARKVRKNLTPYAPTFITSIIALAKGAKSEAVRLNAAKFGLETLYGKGPINEVEAGIEKVIRELTAPPVGQSEHEE